MSSGRAASPCNDRNGWGRRGTGAGADDDGSQPRQTFGSASDASRGGFSRLGGADGACYGWGGVIHVSWASADDSRTKSTSWGRGSRIQGPRNHWGATRLQSHNPETNNNNNIDSDDEKARDSGGGKMTMNDMQGALPDTAKSSSSSSTKSRRPNPLAGFPLMSSVESVPKNDIMGWYGNRLAKYNRKRQLLEGGKPPIAVLEQCWYTWCDNGLPHERKFTSIFTCPVSGERFASGSFGNAKYYKVVEVPLAEKEKDSEHDSSTAMARVVWYTKKKFAEHAAARRALDCFSFRDNEGDMTRSRVVCLEEAYKTREEAPPLPPTPLPLADLWRPTEVLFWSWPNPEADTPMEDDNNDQQDIEFKKEYKSLRILATMET